MKVLIVEDDAVAGLLIERMLKPYLEEGDDITIVRTMADAQAYLTTHGEPDILTLDLNLPDSRWSETIEKINDFKKSGKCVVLVVSGVSEDGLDKKVIAGGADSFLSKGPDFGEKGFLGNLADTFKSLTAQPVRYKAYERIHKLIADKLGTV